MRRALQFCAAAILALACTDNMTEPVPDRTSLSHTTPVAFATTTTEDGLSISTDKDDYQPGDTVHFTGSGWQPGDVLDIVLTDEPLTHDPHTWSVVVGEDGMFHDSTYVVDDGDLDVTFTLVATSRATGRSLTVQFTDGNPESPTAGAQSPSPVTAGATATYTITVTYVGNAEACTVVLSATPTATPSWPAPPIGGFFSFTPSSLTGSNGAAPTSTLTVTVPAGTAANTYKFRITADQSADDDDCQGNNEVSGEISLAVAAATTTTTVNSSQNPSIIGDPVTFTATVTTGSPATPVTTGQVSFKTGGASCADALQVQAPENFVGGQVTYTPSPNLALGSHIIRACYGGTATLGASENSVTQQVNAPSNAAPALQAIGNQTVNELVLLTFTAVANDDPAQTLTYSLSNGSGGAVPAGANIVAASGVFTWTPTEAQGPGSYTFDVCVADDGSPSLSACETITVTVNEVNLPPVLDEIAAQEVNEEALLTFPATATDPDILAGGATNTLSLSLVAGTDPVPSGASISAAGSFSWTPTEAQGPGVYKFKVRVTDDGTPSESDDQEITVTVKEVNKAPVLAGIGNQSVSEGSLLTFTASATDADLPPNTLTYSLAPSGLNLVPTGASIDGTTGVFTWTPADDDPTATASDNFTFKVVVTDNGSPVLTHEETITVTVNNVAPTITGVSLDPTTDGYVYPITSQPKVMAAWTDPGVNDTHNCSYSIKDEVLNTVVSTGLACSASMNAPAAGLYRVTVTVTDDDLGSATQAFPAGGMLIVIYDPSAGFVTGGGWINSPAGACKYAACTSSTIGKATFGFVSKYISQKDKTSPVLTGNTEFQFQAGDLNFKSSSYEWLVVNGNSGRAQYKGEGTVNGVANYGFILTAYDGSPDQFRIKVWDIGTGHVIYDNQMNEPDTSTLATALGGGSVIIHTPKR